MSLSHKVLGPPGGDNALYVVVDTGQSLHPLLFDCGEGCASELKITELQAVEHLCFSHFHMEHVAGFDTFFRHNYNRPEVLVSVWGPEQTCQVMAHRFGGFTWNLHHDQPGEWQVHDILPDGIHSEKFLTREGFAHAHPLSLPSLKGGQIVNHPAFSIEARILNHGTTPSIGYKVIESDRTNICPDSLQKFEISPGPWLQAVSADTSIRPDSETIEISGKSFHLGDLRRDLLISTRGETLAYLTDFCLNEADRPEIMEWLNGTDTLVWEAQYRHADLDLAKKNYHMTTHLVGELARDGKVGQLVLQHISRRYETNEWLEMLAEAREVFPKTNFPVNWKI